MQPHLIQIALFLLATLPAQAQIGLQAPSRVQAGGLRSHSRYTMSSTSPDGSLPVTSSQLTLPWAASQDNWAE